MPKEIFVCPTVSLHQARLKLLVAFFSTTVAEQISIFWPDKEAESWNSQKKSDSLCGGQKKRHFVKGVV